MTHGRRVKKAREQGHETGDRVGRMVQQLSSFTALAEDTGSVPRTPVAISTIIPVPEHLLSSSDLCGHLRTPDTHSTLGHAHRHIA